MTKKCLHCDSELRLLEDGTTLHCDGCGKKFRKKLKLDSVTRLDVRDLSWESQTTPLQKTPEGYLVGRAAVTNIGVFPYTQPGGSVRLELRLPEEVFASTSLDTLKLKPVTNDHPKVKVNASNAKKFTIGSVGQNISTDPYRVYADLTITDQEAVDQIQGQGKIALSCGYDCDLEFTPGIWMGQKYDAIQRNIKYNHLALVKRGRAGEDAVLRLDSADAVCDSSTKESDTPKTEKSTMMKKVTIDGVEYEAEAKVIEILHSTTTRIDSLESELTTAHKDSATLEAERDTLKDRVTQLEAESKTRNDSYPADLEKAVQARIALVTVAQKVGAEFKTDSAESDIQVAVIKKAFPAASLEGKSAEYISARFDSAVELLEKMTNEDSAREAQSAANKAKQGEFKTDSADGSNKPVSSAEARQRMINETVNASRT